MTVGSSTGWRLTCWRSRATATLNGSRATSRLMRRTNAAVWERTLRSHIGSSTGRWRGEYQGANPGGAAIDLDASSRDSNSDFCLIGFTLWGLVETSGAFLARVAFEIRPRPGLHEASGRQHDPPIRIAYRCKIPDRDRQRCDGADECRPVIVISHIFKA